MPLCPQITNTPIDIIPITFAITSITYTPTAATYAASGMTFNIGDSVIVSDTLPDGYNGTFAISSVVAGTSFTVPNTTNAVVTTGTGTAWQAPTSFASDDSKVVYSVQNTDPSSGITTFYASSTPTALNIGDLWFDTSNGNRQSRWDGSTWALVQDTSIATAQSAAVAAQSTANTALSNANTAYATASTSLQTSSNTIVNASNQLTAINGNGVTVYAGSSPNSGARVVLNSAGIAGFNSGGASTFAISSSSGNVSISGASFTSGTISGGSLNINGNCVINSSGFLTATGATITGAITATSGSFTGAIYASSGTIGGMTISGSTISNGGLNLDAGAGTIHTSGNIWIAGDLFLTGQANIGASGIALSGNINMSSGNIIVSSGTLSVSGATTLSSSLSVSGSATITGNLSVQSMSTGGTYAVWWNSSTYRYYYSTSSLRYKENLTEIEDGDYLSAVLNLRPVFFNYKAEFTDDTEQRHFGLVAEEVHESKLLEGIVVIDKEGRPDAVNYDRLSVYLIPALKQMNDRLKALESK